MCQAGKKASGVLQNRKGSPFCCSSRIHWPFTPTVWLRQNGCGDESGAPAVLFFGCRRTAPIWAGAASRSPYLAPRARAWAGTVFSKGIVARHSAGDWIRATRTGLLENFVSGFQSYHQFRGGAELNGAWKSFAVHRLAAILQWRQLAMLPAAQFPRQQEKNPIAMHRCRWRDMGRRFGPGACPESNRLEKARHASKILRFLGIRAHTRAFQQTWAARVAAGLGVRPRYISFINQGRKRIVS